MSRGQNTIKRSEVSTTPILLKYSASYDSSSFTANGITVNRGVNTSFGRDGSNYLNYALVKQLYYQEYLTGSLLFSSSFWNSSNQSTAAEGTFDNDYRYFPTSSSAELTVIGIPRTAFGQQIARKSLCITGSTYKLIDDGNGNIKDVRVTGSNQSSYSAFTNHGVRLYSSGYDIHGFGNYIEWITANTGGSYTGTFWTNPNENTIDGRLNRTGLWSSESQLYVGSGVLTFNLSVATTKTYYIGIGCDDYSSMYIDGVLILDQPYPGGPGTNLRYWTIYPVDLTSGSHEIKFIGNNAGIYNIGNPGSMGIEVYDNTITQISASVTASPNGSVTPAGINMLYSSKDHLSEGVFAKNTHVGNILYSQGVIVITNEEYSNAMIPSTIPTTTTTSTTTTTTTGVPTTTTTSTTSTTTTGIPTTTTSTTTTTTLAPTTTTSTTTVAPTTTTSTTTSTTTVAPTTTTTTSTTTSTTTASPTSLFVYARYINSNGSLQYDINEGSNVTIGALATGCSFMTQITGLTAGDTVNFSEASAFVIAGATGFNAGCPTTGFGCSYPVTISTGPNWVYLTIDGSQGC